MELVVVWLAWLPRPFRLACCAVATLLQVGIILTANYAFLNYLVLALGLLLLDDGVFARLGLRAPAPAACAPVPRWRLLGALAAFAWIFYASVAPWLFAGWPAFLTAPASLLSPFRVVNRYGLFAVMTRERDEIEFQGTRDGRTWTPYPFRYKPQDPAVAPGIYAPYQPRFEWNLWFASLGSWRQNPWVVTAEERLLANEPDVLALFAGNPFAGAPPRQVRAVLWRYWFTDRATRRRTGRWWNREELGLYAPVVERRPDGSAGLAGGP